MTQVLHITPHLGGGIGRVLSGLVEQSNILTPYTEHKIVCLDVPEKLQHINRIRECGSEVIECPSFKQLNELMKKSDIVQLEYINNPIIFKYICKANIPLIRLITWSHNNGLYNPIIPKKLITNSHTFIFTSECSFENQEIVNITPELEHELGVVYSSGGFKDFPEMKLNNVVQELSVGYFGSTIFSKLHPNYADYVNAVKIDNFRVKIVGDLHNKSILENQTNKLEFKGFVEDVIKELKTINVLAYILNPKHYGTTENALIETMSCGIVPIVLDNPPEKCIVEDGKTGFIVHSPIEFAAVLEYLNDNPSERQKIGLNAMKSVREKFSAEKTVFNLDGYYKKVIKMKKRIIDFKSIFGNTPDEWFLSCQRDKSLFRNIGNICTNYSSLKTDYMLFEETKGSVFHFAKYFPENERLKKWAKNLKLLQ